MCVSAAALLMRLTGPIVLPGPREVVLLLCISAAQFLGQVLLNRGLQLVSAVD